MMASDGANVEFDVNMDSINLAIYLKDKGIPDEVCDKLEGKSMYEIASVQKYYMEPHQFLAPKIIPDDVSHYFSKY